MVSPPCEKTSAVSRTHMAALAVQFGLSSLFSFFDAVRHDTFQFR
jgi:hypothetical protein